MNRVKKKNFEVQDIIYQNNELKTDIRKQQVKIPSLLQIHLLTNVFYQNHTFTHGLVTPKVCRPLDGSQKLPIYSYHLVWILRSNCGRFTTNDDASVRTTVIDRPYVISTLIIAATSFCLPVMIGKSFNPEKKVHSYKDEQTRENNFFLLGILSCGTLKVERWFQGLPVGKYLIASSLTLTITNSTCLLRVLLIKRSFVGIFGPVTLSKNMTGKCVFLHWNWSEFGHFFLDIWEQLTQSLSWMKTAGLSLLQMISR